MEPRRARLHLRVSPGADRPVVVGRHGDAWKIRVVARPGTGTRERIGRRAARGVTRAASPDVRIVSGTTSRDKVVELTGLTLAEAEQRLAAVQQGTS